MIDFDLPETLIAQQPVVPRDHARMLVYDRASRTIVDDHFYNLLTYLPDPTCVVVNNSKVEHCRMLFDNGRREIFILEHANDKTVRGLVRPGKYFKLGKTVQLTDAITATVTAVDDDGIRTLQFNHRTDHPELLAAQHVPLPPYITQNDELAAEYQTIYAKPTGSKAAPTAGLHFTNELKQTVQQQRDWAELTLHVGLGTFAPLQEENLKTGRLHHESYEVSTDTLKKIATAQHVTAVGTTSVRTLETLYSRTVDKLLGSSQDSEHDVIKGSTDIFIQPDYHFKRVDSLITNFHLPGTSLLLLTAAFVGSEEELLRIYEHAIAQKYRFYSFGDCMLVL